MQTKRQMLGLRSLEFLIALAVASLLILGNGAWDAQRKSWVAAEAWFRVNEVFVPDHASGSDPLMIYDRDISVPFRGSWVVSVQKEDENKLFSVDSSAPDCSGSGFTHYDPEVIIPDNAVSWSWFVGKNCTLSPGRYRMKVSWIMQRPGWPEKEIRHTSNIFTVY